MANIKNGIQAVNNGNVVSRENTSALGVMVGSASVQARFEKMLGKKSAGFLSSLLSLVNNNKLLKNAEPRSVLAAAATAASLDLPINQSLGKAWIVPYKGAAQFQLGYKGLIALAQRSGQIKSIVSVEVYEGELKNWNKFTEEYELGEKLSDTVVGYFASFELLNGFKKSVYWTRDEVLAHAKRFSKTFNNGPWKTDEIAMSKKVVLSALLKTYAPMSIEMQNAVEMDGKVATFDEQTGQEEFIDADAIDAQNENADVTEGVLVDTETGEVLEK